MNKVIYVASDGNVKAVNTKFRLSKQLLFGPMHIKANFISSSLQEQHANVCFVEKTKTRINVKHEFRVFLYAKRKLNNLISKFNSVEVRS